MTQNIKSSSLIPCTAESANTRTIEGQAEQPGHIGWPTSHDDKLVGLNFKVTNRANALDDSVEKHMQLAARMLYDIIHEWRECHGNAKIQIGLGNPTTKFPNLNREYRNKKQ